MKSLLVFLISLLMLAPAHAQVRLRVSIKQVRDPSGNLPATGIFTNRIAAEDAIRECNTNLALAGFGYQVELTDYTLLTSVNLSGNLPTWSLPPTPGNVGLIEDYAQANSYGWRTDAINVYITQGGGAFIGYCSFPGDNRSTILVSSIDGGRSRGQLLLHEIGHYYHLAHPFNCCSCCDRGANPACSHVFNASGPTATGILDDLLPDLQCDFPDEIATNRFGVGRTVATLNAAELALFSVTYSNLMTYHPQTFLLSNRQRDIWAIIANTSRANSATGRTRFVSNSGFIWGAGSSISLSLPNVWLGLLAADPGDVVMIHAGSYPEPLLINQAITKAVTLGASRGPVTIGQ
jgi:hypothetical protein